MGWVLVIQPTCEDILITGVSDVAEVEQLSGNLALLILAGLRDTLFDFLNTHETKYTCVDKGDKLRNPFPLSVALP